MGLGAVTGASSSREGASLAWHQLQDAPSSFMPGILKSKRNDLLLAFFCVCVGPFGGSPSGRRVVKWGWGDPSWTWVHNTLAGSQACPFSLLLFPIFSFLISEAFVHPLSVHTGSPFSTCVYIHIHISCDFFFLSFFFKRNKAMEIIPYR